MKPAHSYALALFLALTGCAQSHADHPLAGTLEWLPSTLCERWERCSTSEPWGDDSCETWMRATLANRSIASYEELITTGRAAPREDGRARCEALAAGSCDWVVSAAHFPEAMGALGGLAGLAGLGGSLSCSAVIEGLVPIGAACTLPDECVDGATCRDRTCQAPLGEGESGCFVGLGFGRSDCAEGLTCIRDAMSARCVRLPAIGSACITGQTPSCAIGAVCEDGTCAAIDESDRGLGEACSSSTSRCEPGLACVLSVCVVAPLAGEACVPLEGTTSQRTCAPGLGCGEDGLCAPMPSEDEACDGVGGLAGLGDWRFCQGLLACVDEVCVRARAIGEPCASPFECISASCVDGACAAVLFSR